MDFSNVLKFLTKHRWIFVGATVHVVPLVFVIVFACIGRKGAKDEGLFRYVLSLDGAHARRFSNPLGVLSQVASSVSAVATAGAQEAQDYGQKLLKGLNVTASVGLAEGCVRVGFESLATATISKCTPFTKLADLPKTCAILLGLSSLSLASAYTGRALWAAKDSCRKWVVPALCLGSCLGSLAAWLLSLALVLVALSLYDLVQNAADVAHGPAWAMCWAICVAASVHVVGTLILARLTCHSWREDLPASTSVASAGCQKEAGSDTANPDASPLLLPPGLRN
ncbi:hypothetical protein IF2G_10714 [Cordyceps javanica]|nr:hypothetical protein IF2G_10714 [Cordyceps javanica]